MDHYETGAKRLLLNFAIGLGTFIQILDVSIANVAIPYIAGNLSVSADEGSWVITSFSASNAVVLPLTGWLSNYFGRVRLFVWSLILFALTSFLCGLATSLAMLVTFRVIQGAVAGSLIPLSQSLIMSSNPPEKTGGAMGFWAAIVVVAPILGPIIGGYLTYDYSWPWIFYINVPIGFFSAIVVYAILKNKESEIRRDPIDWTGLILLSLAVGTLQILLDKGKDLDWFRSNVIIILAIISIVTTLYFAIWNYFQKYPIVDFSFFKNRNFAFGTLAATLGYLVYFGSTVTVPLWLQTQQGYIPTWAGVAIAPIGLVPLILATTVGKNLHRFDLRVMSALSFIFFAIGFFYQANFTSEVSLGQIMWARFLQGFGVTIFFLPLIQLSLGEISKKNYASASGIFNFIRILVGSGFGTSLSIELWTWMEIFHYNRLGESITSFRGEVTSFYTHLDNQSPAFTNEVIRRVIDQQVEQQAFMLSTNDLSWLGAWLFLALVPVVFLCRKVQPNQKSLSAEH